MMASARYLRREPNSPAYDNFGPMPTDTARVHLRFLGAPRSFQLLIPIGNVRPDALLPVARELAEQATQIAVEEVGGKVSCGPGCGACCSQYVVITVVEAYRLAQIVAALPEPRQTQIRQRFAEAIERLEHARLLGPAGQRGWLSSESGGVESAASRYFRLGISCPFLEQDCCSIHAERPLVCREYLVTSAKESCARYLDEPVTMVPFLGVTRALGRTCRKLLPNTSEGLPLVLALEYSEGRDTSYATLVDGVEAFRAFLEELGETRETSGSAAADSKG